MKALQLYSIIVRVHVPPQQNIVLHRLIRLYMLIGCDKANIYTITSMKPCCIEVQIIC